MNIPNSFRIIITRFNDKRWDVICNPQWDNAKKALNMILHNSANDYAEYKNCGVTYRMIRAENWNEYCDGEIDPSWALDPLTGNWE